MTSLPPEMSRTAEERETLLGFLDYYRAVFVRKAEGVDEEQARTATCPPSNLTITGLVRHMSDVERGWFQRGIAGVSRDVAPPIFYSDDDPERDIELQPGDTLADALHTWHREVDRAREILSAASLDDLDPADQDHSVRWIVVHMIEEYARHCGHLDLIREAIDGQTGD